MATVILLVVAVGALAQCGLSAPLALRVNYTNAIVGFTLKQRIAFRIGQVECLKTLLSEEEYRNAQYGLGSLHRGNYSRDITRFDLKQRIAFLLGQVQCLKIHANLEKNNERSPVQVSPTTMTTQPPPTPLSPNTEETPSPVTSMTQTASASSLSVLPTPLPTPFPPSYYLDCKDAYLKGQTTSGIYTIKPDNQTAFQVYCDMDTDGGGWTVLQRRMDGSVDFNRSWIECEQGFGNLTGEYWLGLIYIHRLTVSASQELRIDLESFDSSTTYALYKNFTIAGAADQYRLQVSGYSGTAGDAMYVNSGQKFTTKDRDNDPWSSNCAVFKKGPWWHRQCSLANLNGKYRFTLVDNHSGVAWRVAGKTDSKKKANMKIRRKNY